MDCKSELLTGSVSVNNSVINTQLNVHNRMNRVTFHYQLDVKLMNDANRNNNFTTFISRTVEACDFFKNPISEPFEYMIYRELTSNKANLVIKSCPIEPV